ESTLDRYKSQAQYANEPRLIRAIEILSSLESELKWNSQPRIMLEMALVKIARPEQEDSLDALLDRISVLEDKLAKGVVVSPSQVQSSGQDFREEKQESNEPSKIGGSEAVQDVQGAAEALEAEVELEQSLES